VQMHLQGDGRGHLSLSLSLSQVITHTHTHTHTRPGSCIAVFRKHASRNAAPKP
jgi:hypothetical protein